MLILQRREAKGSLDRGLLLNISNRSQEICAEHCQSRLVQQGFMQNRSRGLQKVFTKYCEELVEDC